MRFLERFLKKYKQGLKVPRCIQDCIPVQRIYKDGTYYLGKNDYSKSFKFTDINYSQANKDEQERMFLKYCELLNSFDSGAMWQINILNRLPSKNDFEKLKIKNFNDNLKEYRDEYNEIIYDKAKLSSKIIQEKYITCTVEKQSYEDANMYFSRVGTELSKHFAELNSKCIVQNCDDRLKIFHDFYRPKDIGYFKFDILNTIKKGHDFRDYVCPDGMKVKSDYIKMGDKYARVLFLKEYANFIKDSMVSELTDLNKNMLLTINILSVPMDEAVREAENRRLGVETNIANYQRRQNNNLNFNAEITYDLLQQRQESKEFLDDLLMRDQRMFLCTLTIVHTADTKEELDNDTENLLSIVRKHLCQLGVLKYQQLEGLNTSLPVGVNRIKALRTLTTESLAVFMPFRTQEVNDENGIYYGQNLISKNMIIADRRKLLNGNSFILGVSGSGKSFTAKLEIIATILKEPDADVIIIDPEREYSALVKDFGGEIIDISPISKNHINAMDINKEYGDGENPIILKSEFIMSLCEHLIDKDKLGAKEKSIIDRCTSNIYRKYINNGYRGKVPTLKTFREELLRQPEYEAKEIALAIELFTEGSLNTFAKETNVDINKRLICYDILELGTQLKGIGMLVVLDNILNRITENRAKGKSTFLFIDELYLLFQYTYSGNFLSTLWKRVRKYGGFCTGITQNITEILRSETAQIMLANSEFIIMLNQSASDREKLAKLLSISDQELSYITNAVCGQGLIRYANDKIPFINEFPKDKKLYKLITTKPQEVQIKKSIK